MKKMYNAPEMKYSMLSSADVITSSFISVGEDNESNGKYGEVFTVNGAF